jgi:hypothetical protein
VRRNPPLIVLISMIGLLFELEQAVIPRKELDAPVALGSVELSYGPLGLLRLRQRRVA